MLLDSQQWTLVAIIFYGFGRVNVGYPLVHTRVAYFLDWIRSMNVTDVVTVSGNNLGTMTTTSVFYDYLSSYRRLDNDNSSNNSRRLCCSE